MGKPQKRWEKSSPAYHHKLPCPFSQLRQKWKNLWAKRRENNLLWHTRSEAEAEEEATNFVAREIWLEDPRAKNKKAQMPMFDESGPDRAGVVDAKEGK